MSILHSSNHSLSWSVPSLHQEILTYATSHEEWAIYTYTNNNVFVHYQHLMLFNDQNHSLTLIHYTTASNSINLTEPERQLLSNETYSITKENILKIFWIMPNNPDIQIYSQNFTDNPNSTIQNLQIRNNLIKEWEIPDDFIESEEQIVIWKNETNQLTVLYEISTNSSVTTRFQYVAYYEISFDPYSYLVASYLERYIRTRYCDQTTCNVENNIYKFSLNNSSLLQRDNYQENGSPKLSILGFPVISLVTIVTIGILIKMGDKKIQSITYVKK